LGAIDHFIRWEIKALGVGPGARISQLISPMFDAMMRDVFVALCSGGTVCLPPDEDLTLDSKALGKWIAHENINLVHMVPSIFRVMLNQLDSETQLDCLQYVLLSGEKLLPSDVQRWFEKGGRAQLVNLYGPSETTMTKFAHFVTKADASSQVIPIGNPMDGSSALVLNHAGKVCMRGLIGEIYIRTPYRAHGYHLRPDLTAERFVPNPYGHDPEDLVYRTGDLGRLLDDNTFELIGRKDQQIKVRGIRVEPGEIESVLTSYEDISQAVVVSRHDHEGQVCLCAYLVSTESLNMDRVRSHVASMLPDYLAPSIYIQLSSLPLLPNGKLNRQALPAPENLSVLSHRVYTEPRTATEKTIAAMWEEILRIDRVGVLDNFFELGGHSLLITQLMSRLRGVFPIEISLRSFYDLEKLTVENLAGLLISKERRQGEVEYIASTMNRISEFSELELEEVLKNGGTPK